MTNYYINNPIPLAKDSKGNVLEYIVDTQYPQYMRFKVSRKTMEVYFGVLDNELCWKKYDLLSVDPNAPLTPDSVIDQIRNWFDEQIFKKDFK